MKKLVFVAMALFALFLVFSCNNDEAVSGIEDSTNRMAPTKSVVDSTLGFTVKVQDSTMYFSKASELLKALTILKNLPSQERRAWEKSVGFVSAQSLIEDLQKKTKSIEKEEDFKQLIAENSELVKASADDAYGMKSRIYGFYPYITSKRGFFVSEAYWARAFDKKLYSCHFFDHEGYEAMSKLATNSDVSCVDVKSMTLDFNEDEDDNLKSYHHNSEVSSTYIELKLHNYAVNDPTKSATFTMSLENSYAIGSLSTTETKSQCYYIVYYDGACCDPSGYTYYYAAYGGTQYFEEYGNGWRIKVPYANYFDTHPWSNPNWDSDEYYTESYNVYWYNYLGRVDLKCKMTAHSRDPFWGSYSGSVIYFQDVYAGVKVGSDVYYHSTSQQETVGPLGSNYIDLDEVDETKAEGLVWEGLLTEYRDKPLAVFSGCVSGTVSARFCPDVYNFSFNF